MKACRLLATAGSPKAVTVAPQPEQLPARPVTEVAGVLEELGEIARGLHPAVLTDTGCALARGTSGANDRTRVTCSSGCSADDALLTGAQDGTAHP